MSEPRRTLSVIDALVEAGVEPNGATLRAKYPTGPGIGTGAPILNPAFWNSEVTFPGSGKTLEVPIALGKTRGVILTLDGDDQMVELGFDSDPPSPVECPECHGPHLCFGCPRHRIEDGVGRCSDPDKPCPLCPACEALPPEYQTLIKAALAYRDAREDDASTGTLLMCFGALAEAAEALPRTRR